MGMCVICIHLGMQARFIDVHCIHMFECVVECILCVRMPRYAYCVWLLVCLNCVRTENL